MSKIISLNTENFKRLQAVEITPKGDVVIIGGDNAQGKCVPEGTLVSLWDGTRKPIEDIRETDLLIGLNQKTFEFVPEHPVCLMTSGVQEIFEVITERGHKVKVTKKHRLLGTSGWIELQHLSKGDFLAVPMRLPDSKSPDLNNDEALLIGMILGDGCLTENFGYSSGNEDVSLLFARCVKRLFPKAVIRRWQRSANGWCFHVSKGCKSGRLLGAHLEWLEALGLRGCNSYTKFFPEFLFAGSNNTIAHCLAGLLMTDGHIYTSGVGCYYSRSENLAYAVRRLMLRLGIPSSVRIRNITDRPFWKVNVVTDAGRAAMRDIVLPLIPASRLKTQRNNPTGGSQAYSLPPFVVDMLYESGIKGVRTWFHGRNSISRDKFMEFTGPAVLEKNHPLNKFSSLDVGWDEIRSIESIGDLQTFDLQMPSQAFLAEDFIVHNSSVLDSIEAALGGEPKDTMPVRRGAEKSKIIVTLDNGIVVKRVFTATGGTSIVVTNADGIKQMSPQTLLDGLCGKLTFDPLSFSREKPKQQGETLRGIVSLDFTEDNAKREELFSKRTNVNREADSLKSRMAAMPKHDDAPTEEVSASSILDEQRAAAGKNAENETKRNAMRAAKLDLTNNMTSIDALESEISTLKEQLAAKEVSLKNFNSTNEKLDKVLRKLEDECEALADVDLSPFRTRLENVEGGNKKLRENQAREQVVTQYKAKAQEAETLTEQITAIDDKKRKATMEAKFPVAGLGFDLTGAVTFNEIPLEQASEAEKLKVSVAIGLALNPKLKVLLIRDGSLLDDKSMKALLDTAKQHGAQIWLERVGKNDPTAVIIEDGHVKQ